MTEHLPEGIEVRNNTESNWFEVTVGQYLAVLEYGIRGNKIVLAHTEVPPALEGKGVGSALAQAAFEYARANNLSVIVDCPFVKIYLKRHPEYQDLVRS